MSARWPMRHFIELLKYIKTRPKRKLARRWFFFSLFPLFFPSDVLFLKALVSLAALHCDCAFSASYPIELSEPARSATNARQYNKRDGSWTCLVAIAGLRPSGITPNLSIFLDPLLYFAERAGIGPLYQGVLSVCPPMIRHLLGTALGDEYSPSSRDKPYSSLLYPKNVSNMRSF